MTTRRQNRRAVRRSMKGGWAQSGKMWSFMICKAVIDEIGGAPPGVKKNWTESLTWLAKQVRMTPVDLFNRMTPGELLKRLGKQYSTLYSQIGDNWRGVEIERDKALKEGSSWGDSRLPVMPLPGKPVREARGKAANKARAEYAAKREAELKERAYKEARDADVAERWGPETHGALISLAAQKANKNKNFEAVYNGTRKNLRSG